MPGEILRVLVTNAAGPTAYSLFPILANGNAFGHNQHVSFVLYDTTTDQLVLEGIAMELVDCAFPLLDGVVVSSKIEEAVLDMDVMIFIEERSDIGKEAFKVYQQFGVALDKYAKKTSKVLVSGSFSNTVTYILRMFAPTIPSNNFTCLSRLQQNHATAMAASHLKVPVNDVYNIAVWGNISGSYCTDHKFAMLGVSSKPALISNVDSGRLSDIETLVDKGFLKCGNLPTAGMSTANAISEHLHVWCFGTKEGEWTSMGVFSNGAYGIEEGLVFSFPVTVGPAGMIRIVEGLPIDTLTQSVIRHSTRELIEERNSALSQFSPMAHL